MGSNKNELPNEDLILLRVAAGDGQSFRILYDHYWNTVFSIALTYLKSNDEAEDILQQVFVKLWRDKEKLGQLQSFSNYLFIITRNELISALRKQATMGVLYKNYAALEAERTELPAMNVESAELEHLIQASIAQLTPQQQLIYRLSKEENLPLDAIAHKVGLSKKTVSNTLSIILSEIRYYLRKHGIVIAGFILYYILGINV